MFSWIKNPTIGYSLRDWVMGLTIRCWVLEFFFATEAQKSSFQVDQFTVKISENSFPGNIIQNYVLFISARYPFLW